MTGDYARDGFAVVAGLIGPDDVAALRERLRDVTHGGRVPDGVRVQTEPRVARGELAVDDPGDAVRKVEGLALHDARFAALAADPRLLAVLVPILGPDIKLFRDAVLCKPPVVGSQKGWHQDSPYWPIAPMDLCSLWLPLDDATPENGCMAVVAGGHRAGPLPHVAVTDDFVIAPGHVDEGAARLLPMRAGDGLFFHSLIPHYTAPNRSSAWRRAVVLSYMSARSTYTGSGEAPTFRSICGRSHEGCV